MNSKFVMPLILSLLVLSGCMTTNTEADKPELDATEIKQKWTMDGRSPEWTARVNGRRFEASLPGLFENKMARWDVNEKAPLTYLKATNSNIEITFTLNACQVAGASYTHSVMLQLDGKTFKGCANNQ